MRRPVLPLHSRTALALAVTTVVGLVAFLWPFLAPDVAARLGATGHLAHSQDGPWIFVGLLPLLLAIVLAELSDGILDAKAIALLGVLTACVAALRPFGGGATGFQAMFFLLLPAGRVFGRGFGFVLGALGMFASALLTGGVGPWLPFQMIGAGWVGFFAGCLPAARGRAEVALLAAYGAVAGLLYGLLLNLWFWPFGVAGSASALSFDPSASPLTNVHHYLAFYLATSLGFDLPRAVTNAALTLVAGGAVLLALRRAARRAAFDAPVQFDQG
jgi:energy-coupling factor transport system substrate-specific component